VIRREPYAGLATTFDTAAELYERARPGYPRQLFADLAMSTGLRAADARVLEVGAGTAQPVVHRYVWSRDYTAEEYLAVLSTYSGHIAASPQQRETLFTGIRDLIATRPSATVRKHYLNTLQVARSIG
jgi:hypothetical protein